MRLFGDVKVLRGSVAWTNPLRLKIAVFPKSASLPAAADVPPPPIELDEDGRQWVFRFARTAPARCTVDRDRLFEYMRKHKLPPEGVRQVRRDLRNRVDFYTDVRDIQTHPEIEPL